MARGDDEPVRKRQFGPHLRLGPVGIPAPGEEGSPILKGIKAKEIWGPSDVYTVKLPLPGDSKPIVLGQVLVGMKPDDEPLTGAKNEPMMPVAWTKTYTGKSGKTSKVFTTTMGAATDFESVGVRRMLINATYWALGMEDKITDSLNIDYVGEFIVGWRDMHHVIDLLYDRSIPEQMEKAYACYDELLHTFAKEGYGMYRANTAFAEKVAATYGPVKRDVEKRLKKALDPNNIIAPGRCGISL